MKTHEPASRRTNSKPDYGVFDPDNFWGQVMSGPTATDQPDAFDARVEKASCHLLPATQRPHGTA
jgi:hypothetical protein